MTAPASARSLPIACLLALEALLSGADSMRYNLGNGAGYSVNEVIDTARRVHEISNHCKSAPDSGKAVRLGPDHSARSP